MFRRAGVVVVALGLAACSGGSHAAPLAPASSAVAAHEATATVTFSIPLPPRPTAGVARRAAYVSPSSTSLNYSATNGTATLSGTIASLSSYCTSGTTSLACSVPISAPVGSDTFTISLYNGASLLSTHTTTTATVIAEGALNVIPPMILDPVAATLGVSQTETPIGATGAVLVPLTVADALSQPVSGLGTYVTGTADTTAALTLTTVGTANGTFGTNSTCSPSATTFAPWTTTSSLYFCPTSASTLGTIWSVSLGSATTTFSTRRTNLGTTSTAISGGPSTPVGITVASISGNDSLTAFAISGQNGAYSTYVSNFSGSWNNCGSGPPALMSRDGAYVLTVPHGTAHVEQYTYTLATNTCGGSANTTVSTASDVIAFAVDPSPSRTIAYGIAADFNSVRGLYVIDTTSMSIVANGNLRCGTKTSGNNTYPTSVAVGPNENVYVACYNGNGISTYTTQPSLPTGPTVPALTSYGTNSNTGVWVAANSNIAYAVEAGGTVTIHVIAATSPAVTTTTSTLSPTIALSGIADMAHELVNQPLAVGNDDRLYLVVNDGTTNRIIAYDPYTASVVDPAIAASSLDASTLSSLTLSSGPNGTILVGGTAGSTTSYGAVRFP